MPMDANNLALMNMPASMRAEKTVCPNCGNIVSKNNYCEVCDCRLGDYSN